MSEGLSEWQGPAIFFYNSQPAFTSADLDCFTRSVGDSAKAGDSSKIGQFGLGANEQIAVVGAFNSKFDCFVPIRAYR